MAEAAMKRQAQSTDRLGTEKIGKLLMEFSIPAIISMIFNAIYNLVDSVFLGQAVGAVGISVTQLAFPIQIILMGMSALAGQGGNALAAIQLGQDKLKEVEKTLGNTVLLLIVISAVMALIGIFGMDPLLRLVGTTDELYDQTRIFVGIILVFNFVSTIGMGANNFLRTEGKPKLATFTMILGTTVCIVFNYLLVMVLGWGVAGSAAATIIGQACGMVPVLWYLIAGKDAVFRLRLKCMRPDFRLWGKIMSLGVASFVMQVAASIINIILNQTLVRYGALDPIGSAGALSAIGVAGRVNSFAFMPCVGVAMGAQTLIGYNYGARLWKRVRTSFLYAVIFATCIMTFFFALIHIIPVPIVNMFGIRGDLETFCVFALQVMTALFPIVGFQMMGSNYFQSSGQPLKAAILSLTRQVLFLIPLILLLPVVLPNILPITGLQAVPFTYPIADVLSALTTLGFIIPEMHRLNRRAREEKVVAPQVAGATENLEAGDK